MPLKRLAVCTTALLLGLGLATSAQADKVFSLTGGGGQIHIGNGLALPIQAAATPGMMGTVFPPLLIPVNGIPKVLGTVAKPLVGPTGMGKQGYQRRLSIPKGVLSKAPAQKTVGVRASNPTVFAVGTNVQYTWPAGPAVFSTGAVTGANTIAGFGGSLTYSNALGKRFGGPAGFRLAPGPEPAGLMAGPAITVYAKIAADAPCTHTKLGGTNPACVAGILLAAPTGTGVIGGKAGATVTTTGPAVVGKNVAIMKMPSATGFPSLKALAATNTAIPTNAASSVGGPWTTGKVVISNPAAAGGGEKFTLWRTRERLAAGARSSWSRAP
jgi:hypothetical protein